MVKSHLKYIYVIAGLLILSGLLYLVLSERNSAGVLFVKVKKGAFSTEVSVTGELTAKNAVLVLSLIHI